MKSQPTRRLVDVYFDKYAESHENPTNKLIHWICVPLIVFSLFGLIWAIPFPHLEFLGKYNGYVNWASFLIAFAVYYYYKLSPVLSYVMLLIIMVFSAGVVSLEKAHRLNGWPEMWHVCLVIFVVAWIGQFIGHKIEGKKPSFLDDVKFLLIGPIWLVHFVFKRVGIRY
ncbi:MAG TPA: Mpo1-like protein [Daejeonella sp.]